MIKSCANKITSFLFYKNYIDSNKYEYEVYLYGFEVLIASILNILVTLTIGLLFDKFIHSIVFLACYCSIRQFSGGYHASNYRKCFFTFALIFLLTIFIGSNFDFIGLKPIILLLSILNWLNICLLSPVEHTNNPLTDNEKNKYKRNAILNTTLVLLFITLSSNCIVTYEYFIYSSLALFWINIMIIIAIIKNRRK